MRLSTVSSDRGYADWCQLHGTGSSIKVLLDGVEVKRAITADEEAGEVTMLVKCDDGSVKIDPVTCEVITETTSGKVQIVVTPA